MPKPVVEKTESALKSRILLVLIVIIVAVLSSLSYRQLSAGSCQEKYRDDINLQVNHHTLRAQEATTLSQQEQGLSGRTCLGQDRVMLFSFDKPDYYLFWMKDMKFNLDIVWLSDQNQVIHVEQNLSPSTYPQTYGADAPSRYVIEMNGGQAAKLKIVSGTLFKF